MDDIESLKRENIKLHDDITGYRLLIFFLILGIIGLLIQVNLPHTETEDEKEARLEEYESTYSRAFEEGKNEGYSEGRSEGYDEGFSRGYEEGYDLGYTEGEADGYYSGYEKGCSDGYDTCYEDFLAGYLVD